MERGICFYHSADLDGMASGAIFRYWNPDLEMYGYNYGYAFPWDKVAGRDVYMVDVSLKPDEMIRLMEMSHTFTWIDHHVGIINDMEACSEFQAGGLREVGRAACELTWEYLFGTEPPLAIWLLGRYDVWDHKDPRVLPFQYGARMMITNGVYDYNWRDFLQDEIRDTLIVGRTIVKYQAVEDEKYAKAYAFDIIFEDLHLLAVNKGMANSTLLDSVVDHEVHEGTMIFSMRKDGTWKVSLYTARDDIDLSVIAKKYGGGGHKQAAGFIAKDLSFLKRLPYKK